MNYEHIVGRLYGRPLLLTPGKAKAIAAVINARIEGRAYPGHEGTTRHEIDAAGPVRAARMPGGYFLTVEGVGIVQVVGSLVQRGGYLDAESGIMNYGAVSAALATAEGDERVKGIMLEFDSPGGEVAGVVDLAAQIAGAAKPVWAHANELAASAGYWLASAARRLYMAHTAFVGSIGVLALHLDESKRNERVGIAYTPIFAGEKKVDGAPWSPLSSSARADAQADVDRVYELFVGAVAKARGMSAQAVRGTQAGMYGSDEAVRLGLVDGVVSFAEAVHAMATALGQGTASAPAARSTSTVSRSATRGSTADAHQISALEIYERLRAGSSASAAHAPASAPTIGVTQDRSVGIESASNLYARLAREREALIRGDRVDRRDEDIYARLRAEREAMIRR